MVRNDETLTQSKGRVQLMTRAKRLLNSRNARGACSCACPSFLGGEVTTPLIFLLSSTVSALKNDLGHLIKWSQLNTDMHSDAHFQMKATHCAREVGALV